MTAINANPPITLPATICLTSMDDKQRNRRIRKEERQKKKADKGKEGKERKRRNKNKKKRKKKDTAAVFVASPSLDPLIEVSQGSLSSLAFFPTNTEKSIKQLS